MRTCLEPMDTEKIFQDSSGFSVFVNWQCEITVDIYFFTAENVDTMKNRVLSEKCCRKTTQDLGLA